MKYIVFTFEGLGLPIANRLQMEGHDVIVGMVEDHTDFLTEFEKNVTLESEDLKERRLSLYDGIVDKKPARELIKWLQTVKQPEEYFVFFDVNNLFKFADQIKNLGFNGNFPTEEDALFELDRDKAKAFVKKNYPHLNVAEVREFKTVKSAIEFLKSTQELWVLKGKSLEAKATVPDINDPKLAANQLIEVLEKHPAAYEGAGFILELMIPNLIELTPEKIYYDGVPLATVLDIENKPLGSGNISIQTGCAADLVFPTDMKDRINKIAFPPIVDEIAKKHKGLFIWDASLLLNGKNGTVYFGEFCSNRPGYNCLYTEIAQTPGAGYYFESLAKQKSPFTLGTVGTSIRVFNLEREEEKNFEKQGIAIEYKKEFEKNIWIMDAYKEKNEILTAGVDKNVAVITGANSTIEKAADKMYKTVEQGFSFVGNYYRPKADFLSTDYPTSILNRLNYGLKKKLYHLPFDVLVAVDPLD